MQKYDERFHHILDYRRMTDWINRLNHTHYSRNRIHRLMKELNIHSVIRCKAVQKIISNKDVAISAMR
ncbi:transposase [uncultured Dialister sp.]|uniref:transposase n=1 Tax=uncultured Dialister sp. TaxID=278064 RepID=UPI0034C5F3CA